MEKIKVKNINKEGSKAIAIANLAPVVTGWSHWLQCASSFNVLIQLWVFKVGTQPSLKRHLLRKVKLWELRLKADNISKGEPHNLRQWKPNRFRHYQIGAIRGKHNKKGYEFEWVHYSTTLSTQKSHKLGQKDLLNFIWLGVMMIPNPTSLKS